MTVIEQLIPSEAVSETAPPDTYEVPAGSIIDRLSSLAIVTVIVAVMLGWLAVLGYGLYWLYAYH